MEEEEDVLGVELSVDDDELLADIAQYDSDGADSEVLGAAELTCFAG